MYSEDMRSTFIDFQPECFNDLVAIYTLCCCGLLEYLKDFIGRKNNRQMYDALHSILEESYGFPIYQEQIMLISQKVAVFSKGESDVLRKALTKKHLARIKEFRGKFIKGGMLQGYDVEMLEKIWDEILIFAPYAFNKSHAVAYTWISYCMGYLKVYFPHEYNTKYYEQI